MYILLCSPHTDQKQMKHVSDCRRQTRAKQTYNLIGSRGQHEQRPLVVPPPPTLWPRRLLLAETEDSFHVEWILGSAAAACNAFQMLFKRGACSKRMGRATFFATIGYCCCCSWGCRCCCCCFFCWCRFTHSAEMFKLRCSFHYLFLYDANVLNSSVLT